MGSIDLDALERFLGIGKSYCPSTLHAKQVEFMNLECLEALYGGAAGGGKSEALLAGAVQYAHVPNYSALVLRRTYQSLALPDALMARARQWLGPTDAKWDHNTYSWKFPSGAVLQFGYCDTERDLDRYKSSAYQYIAVDELTEWPDSWYTFLFSRLRRLEGSTIPLRVRSATNPDGLGQEWVREMFGIPLGETPTAPIWTDSGDRVFLPARAEDNPSLDLVSYDKSLRKLGPARYQQLRWGKWIRDTEGLVYKATDANIVDTLPELDAYVLGIDYGVKDATAWHVWGWCKNDPTLYGVFTHKQTGMAPSQAADFTLELAVKYPFRRIVGDLGGLGKGFAEETATRHRLPVEPAQKANKLGFIRLLNGDLSTGKIKVHRDGCADLIAEWQKLPWDKGKEREAPGFANHAADAALYGWREAYSWLEKELPAEKSEEERLRDEQKAHWDKLAKERDKRPSRWARAR